MPELVSIDGNQHFPLPPDGGLVGRRDPDSRIDPPDVDLGNLAGGRTVSRRHVIISRAGTSWQLKVHPSARNATLVRGRSLEPEQETELNEGDEIGLGTVSVTFTGADVERFNPNLTSLRGQGSVAEFQGGDRTVQVPPWSGQPITLGRRSDDLQYHPDVDLRDLPAGATISRRHGVLFQEGKKWYLRVEASTTNDTLLNGVLLHHGAQVELNNGDELRMGKAVAIFRAEAAPEWLDEKRLELTVGPPVELAVEAGQTQTTPLTLVNFTRRVHWFTLEVTGIPRTWWTIDSPGSESTPDGRPVLKVDTADWPSAAPHATRQATVTLKPPRSSDAPAGVYPLLVVAASRDNQRLTKTAPAELTLKPFISLRLEIEPEQVQVKGRRGSFEFVVHNDSNVPVTVALESVADPKLKAKLSKTELPLARGAHDKVELTVGIKRWPFLGRDTARKALVTATAEQVSIPREVSLNVPPLIPQPLQRFVPFVLSPVKRVMVLLAMPAALIAAGYFWLLPPDVKVSPDAPLIARGGTTSIAWTVQRGRGEAVFTGPDGVRDVDLPRGRVSVTPSEDFEYKVTATNLIGLSSTGSAKIQVVRVVAFTAKTDALKLPGDPVTLEWSTLNASSVKIDPPDGLPPTLPASGKVDVHPRASTTYTLTAVTDQSRATDTAVAQANFGAAKVMQFQADRPEVFPGDPVNLTWVTDASSVLTLKANPDDLEISSADQDLGQRTTFLVRPVRTTQYTLVATNSDGTPTTAQFTVRVKTLVTPQFDGPVRPISAGDVVTLKWQPIEGLNDRTKVTLQPDGIDVTKRISIDMQPAQTTSYTLVLTGADGQGLVSGALSVPVLPAIREFKVVPAAITEGDPVVLTWSVVDADSVTVTRDDGMVVARGNETEARDNPPASVSSYVLKARNASGESVDSKQSVVAIRVVQPTPTPTPTPQPSPTPVPTATPT